MIQETKKKIEAIDLFCGIGGLTYGLQKTHIKVIAGLDNDGSCEYAYTKNNGSRFICGDITNYDFNAMKSMYSKDSIRVLVGCAPCQPFSSHAYKRNFEIKQGDVRWGLIQHFVRAVEIINPHVISMENVRGIVRTDVFNTFVNDLIKLGYNLDYKVVLCADYGIPQSRFRLVLLGSKIGKIEVPKPTHSPEKHLKVRAVIEKLPQLKHGETDKKDPIHRSQSLAPINIKRIQHSIPGGTWRDWDTRLLPDCYKRESGRTYQNVYGRMSWDKIAPTMTTRFFQYGTGRFGHPMQDRGLSIREGALLQTFPKKYDFGKMTSIGRMGTHIGNAVPPKLGYVISKEICKHIKEHYS